MFSLHIDESNDEIIVLENGREHHLDFKPGIWSADDYRRHWATSGNGVLDGFWGVRLFFLSMPAKGSNESLPVFRVMRGNEMVLFCHTAIQSPWYRSDADDGASDFVSLADSPDPKGKFSRFLVYEHEEKKLPDFVVRMEDFFNWHQGDSTDATDPEYEPSRKLTLDVMGAP
jgi:hypothetical protein